MSLTRRTFLSSTAVSVAAAAALRPSSASAQARGANERVRVGVIGTGRQGQTVMRGHLALPDVEVAAVCDVYEPNLQLGAKLAPEAKQVKDFRAILDDKTIDAVIVATPDHWHALQTVMACQAGKDVYVEKPTSVAIAEGRKMVEAARKYNRVVQVGTQQRSAAHFQQAAKLIQDGVIGRIAAVRCWNFGNQAPDGIGNPPDAEPPAGLDWDAWLGPAPKRPFNPNRFGVFPRVFSHFRWFWDYAGGMMTDWGVHHIDIVHMAMKVDAPQVINAVGGKFVLADNRETPDTIIATYQYAGFTMTYENRTTNGRQINDHGSGLEFYGTEGTLFVDRQGFEITPESKRDEGQFVDRMLARRQGSTTPDNPSHARNFIDCVKSRKAPICDIEIGHRSSSAALLGNVALRSGGTVVWDGKTETVTNGNAKATALLDVAYRAPWKLAV